MGCKVRKDYGEIRKRNKIMLMGITVVCLLSFALAAGIAVLLANNFQQEMLIHDSGIAGYLLNHGEAGSSSLYGDSG